MNSCRSLALALALLPLALHAETIVGTNFSAINVNQTILLGEGFIPPDMSVAVGPNYIVQLVNGGYGVYDRTGANQV